MRQAASPASRSRRQASAIRRPLPSLSALVTWPLAAEWRRQAARDAAASVDDQAADTTPSACETATGPGMSWGAALVTPPSYRQAGPGTRNGAAGSGREEEPRRN
jgi:hypothetical protein